MATVTPIRKPKAPQYVGPSLPWPPAQMRADPPLSMFMPAAGLSEWIDHHLLDTASTLHNADHAHLQDGDIEFLWAAGSYAKQGRIVLGTAEKVAFRAGGWVKQRQEEQMVAWFGRVPAFLVTLAADFWMAPETQDADRLALLEHELYHITQARDDMGAPKFSKDTGLPVLTMRGHDSEEFVGVVRRYGCAHDKTLAELVRAGTMKPEVATAHIAASCGVCLEAAA